MDIKKILNVIWMLLLAVLISQIINYNSNEKMIQNYNNQEYELAANSNLGFFEPYISYYNAGTVYFQKKNYTMAEDRFKKALKSWSPKGRNVKIRINLALSIATPVNPDYVTVSEVDEVVEHLREAQNYLKYKNFANEDGVSGEHGKAQILYNDIEKLIQELLEKKQEEQNQDENNQNQEDQNQGNQNNQNNQSQDGQNQQNDQNDQNNQNGQNNQNNQDNQDNQNNQGNQNQDGQNQDNQDNQQGREPAEDPIRDQLGDLMDYGNQQRNDDLNYDRYMFQYNYNDGENW